MADISSKCLKLISRIPEADQDFLVERIDQLQAEGVSAAEAQQRAAQDLLERVEGDALVTRSASRAPAGVEIVEVEDGFDAMKDGKRIGRLRDNLPRGAAQQLDENASVDIVKVEPEFKGQGVGAALYDAFNEKHGGRITPSGKTSPEAWALWKRQFPEKVDAFVEAEAGRIRDGASASMVVRNIADPEVARRVAEAAGDVAMRSAGRQDDMFAKDMATKRTTVPTQRVVSSKGETEKGVNIDSSGKQITATKQGLENFWGWFGNSEAVNDHGRPLVMYHSTNGDITEFEQGRVTSNNYGLLGDVEVSRSGIFVSPDLDFSQEYLRSGDGQNVMQVYLKIENPADMRHGISSDFVNEMKSVGVSSRWLLNLRDIWEAFDNDDDGSNAFVDALKKAGYDGAIFNEADRDGREHPTYVAFNPEQLKSATGNRGTFDPADADITRSATRPEFFSQLQRSIEAVPDRLATMAAPQWKLWLDANAPKLGVKKDEIEWSGVKDYLDLRGKDKVTRDEIVAYLADSGVRVEETVLGSTGLRDTGEMYVGEANDYGDEWAVFTEDGSIIGGTYESEGAAEQAMDQMNTEGKPTQYGGYTVPGGENYREVLITLPDGRKDAPEQSKRPTVVDGERDENGRAQFNVVRDGEVLDTFTTWSAAQDKAIGIEEDENVSRNLRWQREQPAVYTSNHFAEKNILAHLRVDDRTDADGNKVLFINEIQSDWGQDGKKNGFKAAPTKLSPEEDAAVRAKYAELRSFSPTLFPPMTSTDEMMRGMGTRNMEQAFEAAGLMKSDADLLHPAYDDSTVPRAPFVGDTKAWASLALKRAIMMAVEGGYDRVALITGDQAADLYSLSKQIDNAKWSRRYDGGRMVTLVDLADKEIGVNVNAEGVVVDSSVNGAEGKGLDEVVGKGLAEKIMAEESGNLSGLDLNVGGDGMRTFYDQIIPQVARDVLKKLGGGSLGKATLSHDPNIELSKWEPEDGPGDGSKAKVDTWESPAFDITPAMREKVASGVPLFSKGRTSTGADWESPSASKFDEMIYKFQDKQVDTKRVVEAIKAASGAIADDLNVYLNEELYHGRTAKRTEDFLNMELNPLIEDMAKAGLTIADVEEFLHARHAKEANAVIAARNPGEPGLQDGGSGMTNSEADQYMASLPAADRAKLEAAAARVDGIIAGTRKIFVDNDLESQATVDGWNGMFKHYIPLQREDKEGKPGLGQGFSVKGRETKGRTGSTRKVVDILANVAMQRERAIVRGEKNRVAQALVGLARANENPEFWLVDEVPSERVFNPDTGLVEDRHDPMYKSRENAVVAKIKDVSGAVREHVVLFNEEDERALRMAQALKNLDAQQLNGLLGVSAKITRYFAAVNTQYNPVFGVVNLVRDVQGALLNLTSTPLKDDKAKIAKYTASALAGVYSDMRAARKGKNPNSQWSKLWDEFQEVGGQTGYRDLFATSSDRAEAIQRALDPTKWMDSPLGKVFTANGALKVPLAQAQKQAGFLFDWLSDYNGAMENGVRLAAYKAGLERGLSKEQAASVAKNLTTNFNRKGQAAQQAGAMYAFFNAAIQGTARIGQTLFTMEPGKPKTLRLSPTGKKIVLGGMVLGSVQALALAAAGFSDEDPPEFARERSLIIPTGGKTYVSIPMPLGMHVIPNIGRMATEFVLSGFQDPVKRSIKLTALFADAFNPIGNAGLSMQTLAPTALDPLVALTENKDYTGKPIAKTSSNKAIPGHALGRDTSTMAGQFIAEAINTLSGGNEHVAGVFSPTSDQIDYLIGQVTGGVGREYSKTEQTLKSAVRGEELPTYKIPLVGRFVGNAKGQASEGSAFYANVDKLNEIETEAKGLRADGKRDEAAKLLASKPESYLIAAANTAERQAQKLRREKSELVKAGASREQVKAKEEAITATMARFNRSMEALKERQAATN